MTTIAPRGGAADGFLTRFPRLREEPATRILVHDKRSVAPTAADERELRAVLPGLDLDDQRALLTARRQDIVCTLNPVEEAYLDHLESLGVGPARERIIMAPGGPGAAGIRLLDRLLADPATLRRIAALVPAAAKAVLEPYLAMPSEFAFARALGAVLGREVAGLGETAEIVARANDKRAMRAVAQELGVPVAAGEVVVLEAGQDDRPVDATALRPVLEHHLRATGRVIVRGSRGSAGSAVRIVERTPASVLAALDWAARRPHDPAYLVEIMLPIIVSPNLQMQIDADGVHCVGVTDQRLTGTLRHQGSVYPTQAQTIDQMLDYSEILAGWLRREGYAGLIGIDFCEYADERTGRPKAFLAEINPRINGSTYPLALAGLLDPDCTQIGGFVCGTIQPVARSFAEIADRHGSLLLSRRTCQGALPYNVGYLPRGSCHLVVFDHTRERALARWERTVTAFAA